MIFCERCGAFHVANIKCVRPKPKPPNQLASALVFGCAGIGAIVVFAALIF